MKKSLLYVLVFGMCAITMSAQDASRRRDALQATVRLLSWRQSPGAQRPPAGRRRLPIQMDNFRSQRQDQGTQCRRPAPGTLRCRPVRRISRPTFNRPADQLRFDGREASATATPPAFPRDGIISSQLMRGIMFPNANIVFTVQTHDPAEKKKAGNAAVSDGGLNRSQWGTDLYSGWDIVDYAALALAESAPLMLTPGRRCENGKPVPVNDPDLDQNSPKKWRRWGSGLLPSITEQKPGKGK